MTTHPHTHTTTTVDVNGRLYERNAGGRWSFQPRNGHKRAEIHRTSRLHFSLDALAAARAEIERLSRVPTSVEICAGPGAVRYVIRGGVLQVWVAGWLANAPDDAIETTIDPDCSTWGMAWDRDYRTPAVLGVPT